jgi:hypothetical protein
MWDVCRGALAASSVDVMSTYAASAKKNLKDVWMILRLVPWE